MCVTVRLPVVVGSIDGRGTAAQGRSGRADRVRGRSLGGGAGQPLQAGGLSTFTGTCGRMGPERATGRRTGFVAGVRAAALDLHRSMGLGRVATVHCRRYGVEPLAVTD